MIKYRFIFVLVNVMIKYKFIFVLVNVIILIVVFKVFLQRWIQEPQEALHQVNNVLINLNITIFFG